MAGAEWYVGKLNLENASYAQVMLNYDLNFPIEAVSVLFVPKINSGGMVLARKLAADGKSNEICGTLEQIIEWFSQSQNGNPRVVIVEEDLKEVVKAIYPRFGIPKTLVTPQ